MPIIAQRFIHINGNSDLSISILDEINSCGCIQAELLTKKLNTPLLQLKNTLARIADENNLICDPEFKICCGNNVDFKNLIRNLNKLEGE